MAKVQIVGFCPRYHQAVELIGRRWAGAIVRLLLSGPRRYAELVSGVPEISDRMLTERLRELEAEGIVIRRVIPAIPVRVEYELTAKGHALEGAIRAIAKWAEEWMAPSVGASEVASDVVSAPAAVAPKKKRAAR